MKLMKTEDAVGQVLCHDITQIIPGVKKGPVFKKGHVITPEDVPVLLSVGKDHIYIWENDENHLHENDAAEILRQLCQNEYMSASKPSEGKIELTAQVDGLFLVDTERLFRLNRLGEVDAARSAVGTEPLFRLVPFRELKVGVVTTGNEVFYGRIQDSFTPVIEQKLAEYGCRMAWHTVLNDDHEKITAAANEMLREGADMVLCTGGMSVDPDDKTPLAIRNTGARVVSYGAPVLPGAMFLLAYAEGDRPVCGLPGCVMYAKRTIFDLVLPYLVAGVPVTADQLAAYGNGGLCLSCPVCTFPNCGFGKA